MNDQGIKQLKEKLKNLKEEHRDLDEIISQMYEYKTINLMQIKRLNLSLIKLCIKELWNQ